VAIIQIRDLSLRAIIGIQDWERKKQQDLLINISIEYDAEKAAQTDDIRNAVDYKAIKQNVVKLVESSNFNLVERLAQGILDITMEDPRVISASVTIDKPNALRFSRSVAVTMTAQRS
jgi:D-erythro-7,8-dihydroneopterin triphosphate epimerase